MNLNIDTAKAYLKADGDDDALILQMLGNAQSICEGYCNRRFYVTQEAFDADFTAALADRITSIDAKKAQLAVLPVDNEPDTEDLRRIIGDHYASQIARIAQRTNGVVIDGNIEAAIYLTLGHIYVNREDNVVAATNVNALPVGAQRILQPYLWIGDLADGSHRGS